MLSVIAEIIASNPASILIVLGVILYLLQSGIGLWLVVAGIGLNILWLIR